MNQPFEIFNRTNKKFLPQEGRKRELGNMPEPRRRETTVIFLFSLAFNLSMAILFHFIWNIGSTKALSTTGQGFYFLYSRSSPLKELLLIDPPLPTFLQMAFIPILNLFGIPSFAGPLLSSICSALSLVILDRILLLFRLPEGYRWVLLGLTQCFPSYIYASVIGTSETLYLFVVLVVIYGALQIRGNQMAFLICGFGLAVGFLINYEIISLMVAVALALIIFEWNVNENWQKELEGWMLAFLTPPIYGISLWLIFNQLLMDSPLYFLSQRYTLSHAPSIAINIGVRHPFFLGWDHFFEAIAIAFSRTWGVSLFFTVCVFIVTTLSFINAKRHYISVIIMLLSISTMLTLNIFLGILPSWIYLWMCLIPFGVILIGLIYQDIKPKRRDVLIILMTAVILFSIYLNFNLMKDWGASMGEQRVYSLVTNHLQDEQQLRASDPYWVYQHDAPILANALDEYIQEGRVLMNAGYAAPIAFRVNNPEQLLVVENMSYDTLFEQADNNIAYVLLPEIGQPINDMYALPEYPSIGEDVTWAVEIWESNQTILNWKLFLLDIDSLSNSQ